MFYLSNLAASFSWLAVVWYPLPGRAHSVQHFCVCCPILKTYKTCPCGVLEQELSMDADTNACLRNSSEEMSKRHAIFCQWECYETATRKFNHVFPIYDRADRVLFWSMKM